MSLSDTGVLSALPRPLVPFKIDALPSHDFLPVPAGDSCCCCCCLLFESLLNSMSEFEMLERERELKLPERLGDRPSPSIMPLPVGVFSFSATATDSGVFWCCCCCWATLLIVQEVEDDDEDEEEISRFLPPAPFAAKTLGAVTLLCPCCWRFLLEAAAANSNGFCCSCLSLILYRRFRSY